MGCLLVHAGALGLQELMPMGLSTFAGATPDQQVPSGVASAPEPQPAPHPTSAPEPHPPTPNPPSPAPEPTAGPSPSN
eukprot:33807-Eustigmatos_ZCMA.PRE.1